MNAIERFAAIAAIAAGLAPAAPAAYTIPKLRINQYYDSNAVLQRGVALPICGTADWGRTVTVTFNGATRTATADIETSMTGNGEGRWSVDFPAIDAAGGRYTLTVSDGSTTLTATNITVGDVWLVSGQSNAYYPIERFADAEEWLRDADYPNIRFIEATENHFEWQLNQNEWKISSSATAGKCSATGFFFAKSLQATTNVPMGVVIAATDGSLITEWMPDSTSSKDHYTKMINNYLEPIPPFPLRGVLWYQGESDGMFGFGGEYPGRLTAMIRDWRSLWNDPDLPFIVPQLPFYGAYGQWCDIRLAQNKVAATVPHVHVVPTLDIGDLADIHPPRKPELGARMSAFARKYVYGEAGLWPEGPVLASWEENPSNAREVLLHFDAHGGIASKDGEALRGFQMGGEYFGAVNAKYYDATVRLVDSTTIAVTPTEQYLNPPYVVRYGCKNLEADDVNFCDAAGSPAAAFSTADFVATNTTTHLHDWRLAASGDTLTATCANDGCTAGTPTFSIGGASTKVYDGTPLRASLVGTDFAALTDSELGMLEYYENGVKLSGPPTEVGEYVARVEVDHENTVYVLTKTLTITEGGGGGGIAPSGDATGASDRSAIQAAIDAAAPTHGTVTLGAGLFRIDRQLMVTNGVTLAGQGRDATVVKQVGAAGDDRRVMTVSGGATVERLAITGGNLSTTANYRYGGGVLVNDGTISWCYVTNNTLSCGNMAVGGGVCFTGKGTIDHTVVADNLVQSVSEDQDVGGGIGANQVSGAIAIEACLIRGNRAINTTRHLSGKGGGIGAISMWGTTMTIRNTTIVGNAAGGTGGTDNDSRGGAVYTEGDTGRKLTMVDCILAGNTTANGANLDLAYSGGVDWCLFDAAADTLGAHSLSGDPKFANAGAGDCTLAADSPARGAGTATGVALDLAGNAFADPPSMGCYEYGGEPPPPPARRPRVMFTVD